MYVLSDFRSCGLTGTDSPNWFVSDYSLFERLDTALVDNSLELSLNYVSGFTSFELSKRFTDAEYWDKTCSLSSFILSSNNFVGFVVVFTTFAVTNDSVLTTEFLDHNRRVFTGECTAGVNVTVF